jgi:membrane-bound lytic murein transglycosylase MltF
MHLDVGEHLAPERCQIVVDDGNRREAGVDHLEHVIVFEHIGSDRDDDWRLAARLQVRSPVGAIGVMQVMPPTGKELEVGDITEIEPNIHAGVKYMRFMMDQYFKDEPMDNLNKALMTFASYNAGPGRLRQLRRETEKRGLNPNVWFGNVERVASERIGRETVTYVSNIYKYYITYRLLADQQTRRAAAKAAVAKSN